MSVEEINRERKTANIFLTQGDTNFMQKLEKISSRQCKN